MMTNFSSGDYHTPPGFDVHAMGHRFDYSANSADPENLSLPYSEALNGLIHAAERTVSEMEASELHPPRGMESTPIWPDGTKFRDFQNITYTPRPGFARVVMSGWAGTESGWVQLPLNAEGKRTIDGMATKLLKDVKQEQDNALAPVSDPSQGLVSPPPGFSFRFAGRRLDYQEGSAISFAGISRQALADRLTAALMNAVYRDRRAPIGPWTGDPAKDAKIPIPSQSRVEILGPDSTMITADIPTGRGDEAATKRAAQALADKIAPQIDVINLKAAEHARKFKP